MSAQTACMIVCDGCHKAVSRPIIVSGENEYYFWSARDRLRKELKDTGWTRIGKYNDLCPDCSAKQAEEK